uniref:Bidirectional sugar transporter SWEET n=1 Tax=Hordeum vulgare subsp. vulgare TaxID=112509 RepID=A0A8I6Y3E9_HORVV
MKGLAAADASMSGPAIAFMCMGYMATFFLFYFHFCKVKKMNEDGQVGETKILPFYFVLLNCLVWTLFAFVDIKADWAVFILNGLGVLMMAYCFWSVARLDQNIRLYASIFVSAELLGVLILSILIFTKLKTVEDRKYWLGLIGGIAGAVMYIVSVVTDTLALLGRQGDVEQDVGEDFGMLCASMVNTICWCAYGALYGGKYMVVANGIGLILCLVQSGIYIWKKHGIIARIADINWADAYTSLGDSLRGLTPAAS